MERRSPLHAVHEEQGAKFTEFGGWDMPVEFEPKDLGLSL
ncbi:MAG: hypothetical protein ABEI77_04485 [Halorientalis sp.]